MPGASLASGNTETNQVVLGAVLTLLAPTGAACELSGVFVRKHLAGMEAEQPHQ